MIKSLVKWAIIASCLMLTVILSVTVFANEKVSDFNSIRIKNEGRTIIEWGEYNTIGEPASLIYNDNIYLSLELIKNMFRNEKRVLWNDISRTVNLIDYERSSYRRDQTIQKPDAKGTIWSYNIWGYYLFITSDENERAYELLGREGYRFDDDGVVFVTSLSRAPREGEGHFGVTEYNLTKILYASTADNQDGEVFQTVVTVGGDRFHPQLQEFFINGNDVYYTQFTPTGQTSPIHYVYWVNLENNDEPAIIFSGSDIKIIKLEENALFIENVDFAYDIFTTTAITSYWKIYLDGTKRLEQVSRKLESYR